MIENKNSKSDFQIRLLDTFKRTIDFLDNHGLQWWAYAGTAIGAVRHHGIIPWDDDVDIFMPYPDYCKLLQMKDEFSGTDLSIDIPFVGDNNCPYAKIYDANSTIWQYQQYESLVGLWIDIFPLYRTNASDQDFWQYKDIYQKYMMAYIGSKRKLVWTDFWNLVKGFHLRNLKIWAKDMTINKWNATKNIKEFKAWLETLHTPDGKYWMFPFTYFKCMNKFPVSWFEKTERVPFEDFSVNIPSGNHEILSQLYGDYMTPPPEGKRSSTHGLYFVDLYHHYSIDECKAIIKKRNL